eukprot:GHVU01217259.1.p1 GENE.GHVU01217259.1~~GHVU01217259.1.p1  ORF type:complete len:159 (-),score=10.58 GHVU01217259.1:949-1425(-)
MFFEHFYSLLRLPQQPHFDTGVALQLAIDCLTDLGTREHGSVDSLQKNHSLRGRWFCADRPYEMRLGDPEVVAHHQLQRDHVVWLAGTYYRILSVYQMGYNKWRQEGSAPATKASIVHAVVVKSAMGSFCQDDVLPLESRYPVFTGDSLANARFIISL